MKKICFVTTVSVTMKSFVLETAKHLHNECGYDVTLICSPDEAFQKSLPEYIRFIPVEMVRGVSLSGVSSMLKLAKIFKRERFDLIEYMTPNASFYSSMAGFLSGTKLRIYSQCGIRYVSFSGLKRTIFKTVEKLTCAFSTHVKGQSPQNMQFAIDEGLCKATKISVIGIGGTIGVELDKCRAFDHAQKRAELREKYGIPESAFVYGYVGRVNADKGINELVEAFKIVSETKKDVYLVLVGMLDDANPISEENLAYAKERESIVLTGNVPASEVYHHMAMFDVLTHPTYREGFGKVLQEAMGVGIPIITTNVPGPSEVIEDGVSGILCEVKNPDDLADKMLLLYENTSLREGFSAAGLERAEKYFDRPIMLNNILVDMNGILNR